MAVLYQLTGQHYKNIEILKNGNYKVAVFFGLNIDSCRALVKAMRISVRF